jgi:chorismate mutase
MRLYALRGAISVERNDERAIHEATSELMREILKRNSLTPADVVSCIFTSTEDLDADFPAAAARTVGFESVPLLCAREIDVPTAMPRVIRVMLHYHASEGHRAQHVYLREASALRSDLQAAQ